MEQKNNRFLGGLILGIVLTALVCCVATFALNRNILGVKSSGTGSTQDVIENVLNENSVQKIETIQGIIEGYYLEDVDEAALTEGIYKGLVSGLEDPYSVYYTKDQYEQLMLTTTGTYCGIGAGLSQNMSTGIITVSKVYDGTPAKESGLKDEDILFKVGDMEVTGMDVSEVVTHIKGEEGTKVHVTIVRNDEMLEMDVERRMIELPSMVYEMLENQIGYIQIHEFTDLTPEQFKVALEDLNSQGMKSIVFDVRGNPGGSLPAVCDVLDQLLGEGLIVYTETKEGERKEYDSDENRKLELPMTVLTNGNSASAAEIFAGALKDYGVATLIGTTTFGKGIVQSVIQLEDGSAVKITMAKYYTPKGNYIHEVGIAPDIELEFENGAGKEAEYAKETDNQLQKAIEVLMGQ